MNELYPLLMTPVFQHGATTPWGGHMLRDALLKDAPEDATGASLEISAQPGLESMVANGVHAAKPLSRMVDLWGEALTGLQDGTFPLLLKLLDTLQPLSVQVYPDDEYAAAHGFARGKSKAWIILNAEPGSKIVCGLETGGADLKTIVEENRVGECLRWMNVRPGDVIHIPEGVAHALGEGILCYEIQQPSDASFRLWDWDRTVEDVRPLNVAQALEVCRSELKPEKLEGTTLLCKGGSRTYYVADHHFELCRLNLSGTMPLEGGRMRFLTPLTACTLSWPGGELELKAFDSVIIPAGLDGAALTGETKVLTASLPDRPALAAALGYRAQDVAGLVD